MHAVAAVGVDDVLVNVVAFQQKLDERDVSVDGGVVQHGAARLRLRQHVGAVLNQVAESRKLVPLRCPAQRRLPRAVRLVDGHRAVLHKELHHGEFAVHGRDMQRTQALRTQLQRVDVVLEHQHLRHLGVAVRRAPVKCGAFLGVHRVADGRESVGQVADDRHAPTSAGHMHGGGLKRQAPAGRTDSVGMRRANQQRAGGRDGGPASARTSVESRRSTGTLHSSTR